jgi:hypothetical protein
MQDAQPHVIMPSLRKCGKEGRWLQMYYTTHVQCSVGQVQPSMQKAVMKNLPMYWYTKLTPSEYCDDLPFRDHEIMAQEGYILWGKNWPHPHSWDSVPPDHQALMLLHRNRKPFCILGPWSRWFLWTNHINKMNSIEEVKVKESWWAQQSNQEKSKGDKHATFLTHQTWAQDIKTPRETKSGCHTGKAWSYSSL